MKGRSQRSNAECPFHDGSVILEQNYKTDVTSYAASRVRYFKKIGCLVREQSNSKRVTPACVTSSISIVNNFLGTCVDPLPSPKADDIQEMEEQNPDDVPIERVDDIADRHYPHCDVGRIVNSHYEDWHIGVIVYFETVLDAYKVNHPDNTVDYSKTDEIYFVSRYFRGYLCF